MTWALLALSVSILGSAVLLTLANRPRTLEKRARRKVVVTLKSGASYQGVLHESDSQTVVLCMAVVVPDGTPVDGELLVDRSDVEMIQFP